MVAGPRNHPYFVREGLLDEVGKPAEANGSFSAETECPLGNRSILRASE